MTNESRIKKSSRNILWGIIRQFVILILAFSTRTIFVRLLGTEYVGVGSLYSNILTVLSLAEFGIGNVMLYSLYSPLKNKNYSVIKALVLFYQRLYRIIAAIVATVGLLFIPLLDVIITSELGHDELVLYYLLYLANSVASYFAVHKSTLIQADQNIYIKNFVQTLFMVIQYAGQIVLLLIWRDFLLYLLIQVLCTLGQNIVLNVIADRKYPFLKDKSVHVEFIDKTEIINNTKSMFIYKLSSVLINNTDSILISTILGTAMVGYYTNYYTLITYINLFVNILITGITASIGDMNAENDKHKSYVNFCRLIFIFNIIATFCISCFISVVQDFIPVWIGKEYLLDMKFVIALMSNFYIVTIVTPVWMYRETMGLFKKIRFMMFAAAVINIILSIVLGNKVGLCGIIFATTISRFCTIVWYEPIILFQKFDVPVISYYLMQIKYLVVSFGTIAFSYILCNISVHFNGMTAVFVKLGIVIVVNAIILNIVYFRYDEAKWIKRLLLGKILNRG